MYTASFKIKTFGFILLAVNCFLACNDNSTNNHPPYNPVSETKKTADMNDKVDDNILKLNLQEAIDKYGKPQHREQFTLDKALPEFRIELYNFYTEKEYLNESIQIEELTWEKDKENNITVWYAQLNNKWMPKHYLIWNKESEF